MAEKTAEASASSSRNTIKLDSKTFWRRVKTLYDSWKKNDELLWKSADALVIAQGQADDDNPYKKTNALQTWLLGYEFADTLMVFYERDIYIFTSAKKVAMLEVMKEGGQQELKFLTISKNENAAHIETLINNIKESKAGKNVGVLSKEKMQGPLGDQWEEALSKSGLTSVDATNGFSDLLSVKDSQETKLVKQAAEITTEVMKNHLIPAVETVIDEGTQKPHSVLADEIEEVFNHPEKINAKFADESVESCYIPIIQSGGKYDLKLSASNTSDPLHFGTIVCALGARFKGYCSNSARTFFIDPKKEVEANYRFLLEVHNIVIKAIRPGNKISVVMDKATQYITSKRSELVPFFLKSCGYGIGIEFQEPYLALTNKNNRVIKAGMVFNILVGFQNLELKEEPKDPKNKLYSMMLADTVLVTESGEPEVLTKSIAKSFTDVSYFIEEEQEKEAKPEKKKAKTSSTKKEKSDSSDDDVPKKKGSMSFEARPRDQKVKSESSADKLKKHQEELAAKLARERRDESDDGPKQSTSTGGPSKDLVAYSDPSKFPPEVHRNKILVDVKAEAILLPIYGYLVPFHVSTVKNASRLDDFLRINFVTPTQMVAQTQTGGKDVMYIKELSYRIQDQKSLTTSLRLIKELCKRVKERESEIRDKRGLITQEKLILSKARNPRLMDLFIRPVVSGHRTAGVLEAHVNGFRFTTNKGISVDILYKNIKHAFFQPCDAKLEIVLIHFNLHNAIMIGKKKTNDVQFFSEVLEGSSHLDGSTRSSARDEIEDEQAEADLRNKLNKDFQGFIKRVEEVSAQSGAELEFDIPFRELGFYGVPFKSNVFLQPTVHCLVSLVETPFFVLTLREVEICHLERVQFGLRNFDMVFVFKDYSVPVARVNNVPMDSLESIKEWLDSCNIKFYEGPTNLNWSRIMSTIRADIDKFFEDGGWNFLEPDDGEESGGDSEDEESDFSPVESASEESEEEDYESEADESGSDEYSEESEEDEDEDEEGLDWDELDRKAAAEDRQKKYDEEAPGGKRKRRDDYSESEDEDERPKAKKPSTNGKPATKPPAKPAPKPAAKPATKPATTPATKPATKPATNGVSKSNGTTPLAKKPSPAPPAKKPIPGKK